MNEDLLKQIANSLERSANAEEFLENTKLEMYHDQVFCFTPKGDIIALPRGATPVDFAYAVHSGVGDTCVGAKINGRIVPLKYQLENGDQVEIIEAQVLVHHVRQRQLAAVAQIEPRCLRMSGLQDEMTRNV